MFAFVMLWAYFNFSQFLLTYAANLVEEIPYMITRISHGWQYLALFLIVFHFAVPWLLLLSRKTKRTPQRLVIIAAWMLFVALRRSLHDGVAGVRVERREPAPADGRARVSHFFVHWLDLAAPLADRRPVALDVLHAAAAAADAGGRRSVSARVAGHRRRAPLMAHAHPTAPSRAAASHGTPVTHAVRGRRVPRHAAGRGPRAHRRQRLDHRQVRAVAGDFGDRHPRRHGLAVRAVRAAARGDESGVPAGARPGAAAAGRRRGCSSSRRTRSTSSGMQEEARAAAVRLGRSRRRAWCEIPIAEAMRLTVERGLPGARAQASPTAGGRTRQQRRPDARGLELGPDDGKKKAVGDGTEFRIQNQNAGAWSSRSSRRCLHFAFCILHCAAHAPSSSPACPVRWATRPASSPRTCRRSSRP